MVDKHEVRDDLTPRARVSFGDRVRIRATDATVEAGLAGQVGTVFGLTTPSLGFVDDIVGDPIDDVAVNVNLEQGHGSVWFAPSLLEFLDHTPGLEIRIGEKGFMRTESGEWKAKEVE
jgi:hypothetical protein